MAWVDAKTEDRANRHNDLAESYVDAASEKERQRLPFTVNEQYETILALRARHPADYASLGAQTRMGAAFYEAARDAYEAAEG